MKKNEEKVKKKEISDVQKHIKVLRDIKRTVKGTNAKTIKECYGLSLVFNNDGTFYKNIVDSSFEYQYAINDACPNKTHLIRIINKEIELQNDLLYKSQDEMFEKFMSKLDHFKDEYELEEHQYEEKELFKDYIFREIKVEKDYQKFIAKLSVCKSDMDEKELYLEYLDVFWKCEIEKTIAISSKLSNNERLKLMCADDYYSRNEVRKRKLVQLSTLVEKPEPLTT